ncbi:DUF6660 family protein [uncultured Polaribacter sp.]|uniref:DUF6660 family protein n=1 Tax=uncultured Polaribacter sp. TaxID=174711 RepID=UPI002624178C|nr:DUF6660 family protein [uncultured Polaribacter sp.]
MKYLTLIFAVITLALSTVPCTDGINETADTFQTENHSDHSDDGCTPFCTCACCGIAIPFEVFVFEDEQLNTTLISHSFNYENLFTQGFITSIWHPPAIG